MCFFNCIRGSSKVAPEPSLSPPSVNQISTPNLNQRATSVILRVLQTPSPSKNMPSHQIISPFQTVDSDDQKVVSPLPYAQPKPPRHNLNNYKPTTALSILQKTPDSSSKDQEPNQAIPLPRTDNFKTINIVRDPHYAHEPPPYIAPCPKQCAEKEITWWDLRRGVATSLCLHQINS